MARKKRGRRGSRQFTLPLAPIAGLIAGLARPAGFLMSGSYDRAFKALTQNYTGYDIASKKWDFNYLKEGLLPLVLGGLVHKYVGGAPLNINRMLANAGVPVVRI